MQTTRRNAALPTATARTAKPAALLIAGSFLGLALAGCGSGDDAPPTGPPDNPRLSYAPIAGVWVGEGDTREDPPRGFSIRLSIGESAVKGDSVGTVHYEASDQSFECDGALFADAVDGDVYEVRQAFELGSGIGCSEGQVRLTHDADASRLFLEFFVNDELSATGRLSRE